MWSPLKQVGVWVPWSKVLKDYLDLHLKATTVKHTLSHTHTLFIFSIISETFQRDPYLRTTCFKKATLNKKRTVYVLHIHALTLLLFLWHTQKTLTHIVGVFFFFWLVRSPGLSPRPWTAPQLLLLQPNGSDNWMHTGIDFTQPTSPVCVCVRNSCQKLSNHTNTHTRIQRLTQKGSQTVYVNKILWRNTLRVACMCECGWDPFVSPMTICHSVLRFWSDQYHCLTFYWTPKKQLSLQVKQLPKKQGSVHTHTDTRKDKYLSQC